MAIYRFQVRIPWDSGNDQDVSVNVFHGDCTNDSVADDFADWLIGFYQGIDGIYSVLVDGSADACSVTAYRMAEPTPRVPAFVKTFQMTPGTETLPCEAALCLSFQGIRISGQPQARRRGRVYLGPLHTGVLLAGTGRVDPVEQDLVRDQAQILLDGLTALAGGTWGVWSTTDDELVPIENGWVDNEFDTIRARGLEPTSRLTFAN